MSPLNSTKDLSACDFFLQNIISLPIGIILCSAYSVLSIALVFIISTPPMRPLLDYNQQAPLPYHRWSINSMARIQYLDTPLFEGVTAHVVDELSSLLIRHR